MRCVSRQCSILLRFEYALSVVLMFAMFGNSVAFAADAPLDAAKAKQVLIGRGIGSEVRITKSDGSKVKATITALHDDTFEVTRQETPHVLWVKVQMVGTPVTIAYADVTRIRNGESSAWNYVWIVAIAISLAIAIYLKGTA